MKQNKITYKECLQIYEIEEAFLDALQNSDLIKITVEEEDKYIYYDSLSDIEQFIRWYYELEINVEGIEALYHMLKQVKTLHEHIEELKNELKFYKSIL